MSYAARLRAAYPFKPPNTSVDHVVIGGGIVGLSVAAGLVNTAGRDRTTFLVERNAQASLRSAISKLRLILAAWAGNNRQELGGHTFCYPVGSLKSRLCIRGRDMIYERCQALDIGHRKTQKLIVATSNSQVPYLDKLSTLSADPRLRTSSADRSVHESDSMVPAYFLSRNEALEMEPDLTPNLAAALLITETGIVDSQGLVDSLAREVEEEDYLSSAGQEAIGVGMRGGKQETERGEGVVVLGTRVVRIDREVDGDGWIVQLETGWDGLGKGEKGEVESVRASVVVNAAGLGSTDLLDGLVPERDRVQMWPVKGNYMSYKGPGVSNISRLIYPCPSANIDSLGTHLTLDLDGNIKFGPDVENIGGPSEMTSDPEFWRAHLAPSEARLEQIGRAVLDYLPRIDTSLLTPDYAGIRPNIAPPGAGFSDFMIRHQPERRGLIELLGFNSPGLTSSLATGEYVARMVRRDVYGESAGVEKLADGWE